MIKCQINFQSTTDISFHEEFQIIALNMIAKAASNNVDTLDYMGRGRGGGRGSECSHVVIIMRKGRGSGELQFVCT